MEPLTIKIDKSDVEELISKYSYEIEYLNFMHDTLKEWMMCADAEYLFERAQQAYKEEFQRDIPEDFK